MEALKAKNGKPRPSYYCHRCGNSYWSDRDRMSHIKRVHSKECPVCKKVFSRMEHLRRHENNIHKSLPCPECGEVLSGKDVMKAHKLSAHPPRYLCENCGEFFMQKQTLIRHKEEVHMGRYYECPNCQKEYTRKDKLREHHKKCSSTKNL